MSIQFRRLFTCVVFGFGVCALASGAATFLEPVLEWEVDLASGMSPSPVPYPAKNPDSFLVGMGGRVVRVRGDGAVLFDVSFGPETSRGGISDAMPADLDGDGVEEIVAGHKAGYVYALNGGDGAVLWEYPLGPALDAWQMATPADLDGDGVAEVLAPSMTGWLYCLDGDGSLRWRSRVADYALSTPSVGDIDGDGAPEIVYGTATRRLIALESDGTLLWESFVPPHHMARTTPLIADVDEDGKAEVYTLSSMIGADVGLISVDGKSGSLRWIGATYHKAYMGLSLTRFSDGTQGIVAADKGGNVMAYDVEGRQRWRTRVSGRGIWTPPVSADLDGEGTQEIVTGVRGVSLDGKGNSWYILSSEGEILGAYPRDGGQFGAPLVIDADHDSVLELILVSDKGIVSAYTFGGEARPGAVAAGHTREDFSGAMLPEASGNPRQRAGEIDILRRRDDYGFGLNAEALNTSGTHAVEVATTFPGGARQIEVFRPTEGKDDRSVQWPAKQDGVHSLDLRMIAATPIGSDPVQAVFTGHAGAVLGTQHLRVRLRTLKQRFAERSGEGRARIEAVADHARESGSAETAQFLVQRLTDLEARSDVLREAIPIFKDRPLVEFDAQVHSLDTFFADLDATHRLADLLAQRLDAEAESPLLLWQDANPWDEVKPAWTLPEAESEEPLHVWAFGNEIESAVVNIQNVSPTPLTLRVENGTLTDLASAEALKQVVISDVARLHRVVWLPSVFADSVPDLLPELSGGYLLDIAPGEVRQLWINVSTRELAAGSYELSWPLHVLDARAYTTPLRIHLEVSPVRLPEKSRFYANFWSRNQVGDISTIEDLNEHLQTVWYGVPLPPAEFDLRGRLVNGPDWTAHDAVIGGARQVARILYSWIPAPRFPEAGDATEAVKIVAQRGYVDLMFEHLRGMGIPEDAPMFYVEDEPGLHGTVEHYLQRARELKEIDPRLQAYANPWGAITTKNIEEMSPVTDFWQPGMETIEFLGPEYLEAMQAGGKPISTYTPPGNIRGLEPLGFFRAQAWQAFHWGIEGGGWWVYHGDDLWGTAPGKEPGYGGVDVDGRELTVSRRWEANRDGIEDFNLLTLLREESEASGDRKSLEAIQRAVQFVADRTITGMPREAAAYDLDFEAFMVHRQALRTAAERLLR